MTQHVLACYLSLCALFHKHYTFTFAPKFRILKHKLYFSTNFLMHLEIGSIVVFGPELSRVSAMVQDVSVHTNQLYWNDFTVVVTNRKIFMLFIGNVWYLNWFHHKCDSILASYIMIFL